MCNKVIQNFSNNTSIKKYANLNRLAIILENKLKLLKLGSFLRMMKFLYSKSCSKRIKAKSNRNNNFKNYDFNDVQLSSIEKKEIEDLKECTFIPKTISKSISNLIKNPNLSMSPSFVKTSINADDKSFLLSKDAKLQSNRENHTNSAINVFGRLYNEVQLRSNKKIDKTLERSIEISKELTFSPKLNKNNKIYNESFKRSRSISHIRQPFDQEMEKVNYLRMITI